jgi:hypothetical protein
MNAHRDTPAFAEGRGGTPSPLRSANEALYFLVELAMLVAFSYCGFSGFSGALAWVFGLGLPVLIAGLWALLFAPRAARRLPPVPGVLFSTLLFVAASLLLLGRNHLVLGGLFLLLALVNRILVALLKQW